MSNYYAKSGVNIKKGDVAVKRIKSDVASTHTKEVLLNIGSFGGLFELTDIVKRYTNPVLVQSIDGVGTKLSVAKMMSKYDSVGEDIVSHCCGDIVAMGARPLTFLDYVANETLVPEEMKEMVHGMAKACREAGVALIGGETAEMPGTYAKGEHDIAGCITGIVEKDKIITGEKIKSGDIVFGFPSSGLHTNGFSLVRQLVFNIARLAVNTKVMELGNTLGAELLKVHINYATPVLKVLDSGVDVRGIAHITGGGFMENIPRILPKNLNAEIYRNSWPMLPIFPYLQKIGKITESEMYSVFNMGIGMIIIVPPIHEKKIGLVLKDYKIFPIGKIIKGKGKVILK